MYVFRGVILLTGILAWHNITTIYLSTPSWWHNGWQASIMRGSQEPSDVAEWRSTVLTCVPVAMLDVKPSVAVALYFVIWRQCGIHVIKRKRRTEQTSLMINSLGFWSVFLSRMNEDRQDKWRERLPSHVQTIFHRRTTRGQMNCLFSMWSVNKCLSH